MEKPTISWNDIGGLSEQINEIKEVVELPFKHPELIQKIGIVPPKGILLYGKPGTGKTLLAKAVAHEINATFIELVGSELVQKFIGEGAKLVKRIFELARKKTPTIIFIDEIDSVAGKRIELGTSGEREVQRTFMQLLSEMDGFKNMENITVIGATNRIDILDPAILRPGRFDRLIEVPKAKTIEAISQIFKIHTKNLNIENDIDNIIIPMLMDFSGAEIRAICNEAAYFALREKRDTINYIDFKSAINKIKKKENSDDGLFMFG
jgi:proteasome regulatory subunit